MCWNWQVSLTTWLIATLCAVVLIQRKRPNDVTLAIVLLVYSSIQLWEALMWLDPSCGTMNQFATYAAYYALYAHLLAFGIGLYIENQLVIPLVLGVLTMLLAVALQPKMQCSVPSKNCGHLKWGFNTDFYKYVFWTCLVIAFAYFRPLTPALLVFAMPGLSFMLSYFFFHKDASASMVFHRCCGWTLVLVV
jgi:hypothetical protein